jgi:hypothetical protein
MGVRELIKLLQQYEPGEGAEDVPVAVMVEGRAVDLTNDLPDVVLYPKGLRICLASEES